MLLAGMYQLQIALWASCSICPPWLHVQHVVCGADPGHVLHRPHHTSLRHMLHVVPTMGWPCMLELAHGGSLWVPIWTISGSSMRGWTGEGTICSTHQDLPCVLCAMCTGSRLSWHGAYRTDTGCMNGVCPWWLGWGMAALAAARAWWQQQQEPSGCKCGSSIQDWSSMGVTCSAHPRLAHATCRSHQIGSICSLKGWKGTELRSFMSLASVHIKGE